MSERFSYIKRCQSSGFSSAYDNDKKFWSILDPKGNLFADGFKNVWLIRETSLFYINNLTTIKFIAKFQTSEENYFFISDKGEIYWEGYRELVKVSLKNQILKRINVYTLDRKLIKLLKI